MHSNVLSLISLILYLGLVLLPLGLSLALNLPQRPWPDQLSSHFAMIGFNLILLEFFTTGRLKLLSRILGIDWVLQVHQLLARLAALLLLIHPFLYTLPNKPSGLYVSSDAQFLGINLASSLTGMLALITLIILIGLALTRQNSGLRYETWRASHAIMALLVVVLGFHHTTHAGRFSQEPWILIYWQIALALALLSIAWVYLIQPLIQAQQAYQVVSIREVAARIWELVIERPSSTKSSTPSLKYQAGQFVWLKIGHPRPLYENPFSIASCPDENSTQLKFLIKEVGDFTHQVSQLNKDDRIFVDGAYGNFGQKIYAPETQELVLIAGGVGIAPVLSLIRSLAKSSDPTLLKKKIVLIYGNRAPEQIIDLAKMVNLQAFEQLTQINVISEPNQAWQGEVGVLDAATLNRILKSTGIEVTKAQYFVCGPAVMIDAVENTLDEMGVQVNQIDSEKFQYDLTQKNPRNRRSIVTWLMASATLIGLATYWAMR